MQLPQPFVAAMQQLLGDEQATRLFESLDTPPPVSIRLNASKYSAVTDKADLSAYTRVPWAEDAYYLPQRPPFTYDPLLHAGAYYVQEASSMSLSAVAALLPDRPLRMLDLCAAPGGKSTLWRSLLPASSLLVANEPMPQRARILAENLTKWGHPDVAVTNNYPADFAPLTAYFDLIAADVPCSGEGMFRKDEGAVAEWSLQNVEACRVRQRNIVRDIWPCLRQGGLFVYSTCTFNRAEDEDNVRHICQTLGAELVETTLPEQVGICRDVDGLNEPMFHFYPHRTTGEGFFFAVLRKTADDPAPGHTRPPKRTKPANAATAGVINELSPWLHTDDPLTWRQSENNVWVEHSTHATHFDLLRAHLKVLTAGIEVAEAKGKKWQPSHALALSRWINTSAFTQAALTHEEALAYLRREAIVLSPDLPRGHTIVTYRGLPLGFVNHLGHRANNLYPDAWRIRSSHHHVITPII